MLEPLSVFVALLGSCNRLIHAHVHSPGSTDCLSHAWCWKTAVRDTNLVSALVQLTVQASVCSPCLYFLPLNALDISFRCFHWSPVPSDPVPPAPVCKMGQGIHRLCRLEQVASSELLAGNFAGVALPPTLASSRKIKHLRAETLAASSSAYG